MEKMQLSKSSFQRKRKTSKNSPEWKMILMTKSIGIQFSQTNGHAGIIVYRPPPDYKISGGIMNLAQPKVILMDTEALLGMKVKFHQDCHLKTKLYG